MPFTFSNSQKGVAVFIIIGLFLLAAILTFILKGNKLLDQKDTFYAWFDETKGLSAGGQVKFKGVTIGTIKKVVLTEGYRIKVTIAIAHEYRDLIRLDSVVKPASSLLGSAGLTIVFRQDSSAPLLPEGAEVQSTDTPKGQEILLSLVGTQPKGDDLTLKAQSVLDMILELKPAISQTLGGLMKTSQELNLLTASINGRGDSATGLKILSMLDSFNATATNLKNLSLALSSGEGSVIADIKDVTTRLKDVTSSLNGAVININTLTNNLKFLPPELKDALALLKEDLIELKYVLQNIPLVPKSDETQQSQVSSGTR